MRDTEAKHAQAIRDLEGMLKANDVRSKHDLSQSKMAAEKQESELRAVHEKALKECEDTIQSLERELTALKGNDHFFGPIASYFTNVPLCNYI